MKILEVYADEFGKEVSAFSHFNLLKSLILRPDFAEIFQPLCEKLFHDGIRKSEKALFFLATLTMARNTRATDAASLIKLTIGDASAADLGDIKTKIEFLFSYLEQEEAITVNDPLLPFLRNFYLEKRNEFLETPLMVAVRMGHLEAVKSLLNANANIYAIFPDHSNLLMIAAQNGHAEIARLLVRSGINVCAQNNNGTTALLIAAGFNQPNVVRALGEELENYEKVACAAICDRLG